MRHRTGFLLGILAALAIPTSALAATPESGTVSPDSKTATATGTIVDPLGAYDLAVYEYGSTAVRGNETCTQPACEIYTLTVADGAQDLRIVADAPTSENVSMDISDPEGGRYFHNTVDYFTNRTFLGAAIPGEWTIRVFGTGDLDTFDYKLTSEINLPGDPAFVPPTDGSDATD